MHTLLIPTDGSDPAENAARTGFDLAEQLGATVHVLAVVDSSLVASASYVGDSPRIRDRLHERAEGWATALGDRARDRGLDAVETVRTGIPADEIVAYADAEGVDAIVMGTAGRGGVGRLVVGSVTDKVIRTSSVPVLAVNRNAMDAGARLSSVDSLLVPTDGSDPAEAAAGRALDLAERLDATVHLLSVADVDVDDGLLEAFDGDGESVDALLERAGEHLASLVSEARERELEVVTATADGRPAEQIVAYADEQDVDAIAMGTHGRGGFERLVVGSVTDEVVRTASVPVLTVGPDADALGPGATG